MNTKINRLLMHEAKINLSGCLGRCALATLIYVAIMGIVSCSYIGELILFGPMTLGYVIYIVKICRRREPVTFKTLFDGFRQFSQALIAGLIYSLAVSVGLFFLIIPGIIVGLGFALTFPIMSDEPGISGMDALQQSWVMMRGHKWQLFCLGFRFIGWWVLSVLSLGIGFLWLYPYMTASLIGFYNVLKQDYNRCNGID